MAVTRAPHREPQYESRQTATEPTSAISAAAETTSSRNRDSESGSGAARSPPVLDPTDVETGLQNQIAKEAEPSLGFRVQTVAEYALVSVSIKSAA